MRVANVRERKWRDVNSTSRAIGSRSTLLRCSVRSHKLSGSAVPHLALQLRVHCMLLRLNDSVDSNRASADWVGERVMSCFRTQKTTSWRSRFGHSSDTTSLNRLLC